MVSQIQPDPRRLTAAARTAKIIAGLRDAAHELAFAGAEHFLQQVVDLKDADKETFWRQVFAEYVRVVKKRGMRDWIEWQRVQNAALYTDGENPRYDPTLEEEGTDDEAVHFAYEPPPSDEDALTRTAPERDYAEEDDEIPF